MIEQMHLWDNNNLYFASLTQTLVNKANIIKTRLIVSMA